MPSTLPPNQVGGAVGAVGATGAVGDTQYDPITGNLSVNNGSGWITVSPGTGPTYYTSAATYQVNSTGLHTTGYDNQFTSDVTLRRNGKPDLKIGESIDIIMERLCLIIPAIEKMEKYPALKEAYENYKLIEALIQNDESDKDE